MSAFILLHSLLFIYFGFRQWRSRIDRVLNLNMNIRHPLRLFRALGVGPGAQTRPHVLALRMDVVIAIVEPPSKCHKVLGP